MDLLSVRKFSYNASILPYPRSVNEIFCPNVLLANEQVIVNAKYRTKENVELLFEDGLLYSKKKLEVKQSRFVAETDAVFEINLDKKNIIRNSLVVLNGPPIDSNKIEWEEGRIRLETAYSGKIEIQFDYYDYFGCFGANVAVAVALWHRLPLVLRVVVDPYIVFLLFEELCGERVPAQRDSC